MKNLTEIITAVLIILFLGFFVIRNCECCKSKCSVEEVETKEADIPNLTIDASIEGVQVKDFCKHD